MQQYLTDEAARAVQDLLPAVAEGDLASVCSWADEMRFPYRWASPLLTPLESATTSTQV